MGDEIVVQSENLWPDYVFKSSYNIMPIYELEKYINCNKHLPGLPTAAEVEQEGQKLAKNQALLLEKIEELTIYVIEQNKRIEKLEIENKKLKR